jgi:single-stranded-DNA-specific exonuclease
MGNSEKVEYQLRPLPDNISQGAPQELASELDIPLSGAKMMLSRGIGGSDEARSFLAPQLTDLPSPFLFPDMEKAVHLIEQALIKKWPVIVYGDYDVDGISGTALLVNFFSEIGLETSYHLPNRLTEGYGLSFAAIEALYEKVPPPAVLVTVDNGITAVDEITECRRLGYTVILTDHHEVPEKCPEPDALLNPKIANCPFPFPELSGAGVAFFFLVALRSTLRKKEFWVNGDMPNLKDALDLVALGTVADVMPLKGVNRILVRSGLEVLSQRKRPGLLALCEVIGLREGDITSGDIGYRIGPRINACGRMGSPQTPLELLLAKELVTARGLAQTLNEQNNKRRKIEGEILDKAIVLAKEQVSNNVDILVIFNEGWHPGVIGIIASRLVDMFNRPAIVLTDDVLKKDCIKGSGRTIRQVNIHEMVSACRDFLEQFGGHHGAIGLSMKKDNLDGFRRKINGEIKLKMSVIPRNEKIIKVDFIFDDRCPVDLTIPSFLRHLEPFGRENPEPVFLAKQQYLSNLKLFSEKHLSFTLTFKGQKFRGIGFNMEKEYDLAGIQPVDLAFSFIHSVFRGVKKVGVRAVAITPAN